MLKMILESVKDLKFTKEGRYIGVDHKGYVRSYLYEKGNWYIERNDAGNFERVDNASIIKILSWKCCHES